MNQERVIDLINALIVMSLLVQGIKFFLFVLVVHTWILALLYGVAIMFLTVLDLSGSPRNRRFPREIPFPHFLYFMHGAAAGAASPFLSSINSLLSSSRFPVTEPPLFISDSVNAIIGWGLGGLSLGCLLLGLLAHELRHASASPDGASPKTSDPNPPVPPLPALPDPARLIEAADAERFRLDQEISRIAEEIHARQKRLVKLQSQWLEEEHALAALRNRVVVNTVPLSTHARVFSEQIRGRLRDGGSPLAAESRALALTLYCLLKDRFVAAGVLPVLHRHPVFQPAERVRLINLLMEVYADKITACRQRFADNAVLQGKLAAFWRRRRDLDLKLIIADPRETPVPTAVAPPATDGQRLISGPSPSGYTLFPFGHQDHA